MILDQGRSSAFGTADEVAEQIVTLRRDTNITGIMFRLPLWSEREVHRIAPVFAQPPSSFGAYQPSPKQNSAGGRRVQLGEHARHGRLATSALSHQRGGAAGLERNRGIFNGADGVSAREGIAPVDGEQLAQMRYLQDWGAGSVIGIAC